MRGLTLAPERETLIDWHERIAVYLREHLRLELNAKRTRLRPVSAGVDFVGYIARRDYLLLRRRVVSNIKFKLKEYHAELVREGRYWRRYRFDEEELDKLFATLCSYLGHSLMANTYNLWGSLWRSHLDKLLRSGRSVALIGERDVYFTGVRVRLSVLRLEAMA